jgi:hypothetical protein
MLSTLGLTLSVSELSEKGVLQDSIGRSPTHSKVISTHNSLGWLVRVVLILVFDHPLNLIVFQLPFLVIVVVQNF